ncbi:DNA-binding transcriptional regulator GbsR (MarR family) [Lipingzhangella halophila]|uniref:DNA-binding transcriptional regulator GbsR (MarR family) n=1 Tax=Lipingzhangella halophila TaxID=1783352 RepID=A0A7W7W5Q8_9ACTN|nr:helix-turn-helix domain-containing protein [Lipingzhangella halophila]MBB4935487.1 DNA-binding transcriptional regulator GbsR (MarR family) [Lipingzhangella halophila]
MPGTRLTRRDRRVIATGLADGLGYAEIARRLARPTSTISREITRNGGPAGYDPDLAHRATKRRARRRKPAPEPATSPGRHTPETVRAFEQQLATTLVHTGLSRMPARVLAALHTTDEGSLTAVELGQHLRVSSASVSKAIGHLEGQGIIRREHVPRRRAERYVVDPDAWFQALLASAQRNHQLADTARQGADLLGSTTPAGARLYALSRFHQQVTNDITDRARRWRHILTEAPQRSSSTRM